MSFTGRPLEEDNPKDVRKLAQKLLKKLQTVSGQEATIDDLYGRFCGSQEPKALVRKTCMALVAHESSPVSRRDGETLYLKHPNTVVEYCDLIEAEQTDLLAKLKESDNSS
ncbi:hypothetical protein [Natrarchaeobaculum sulfurireducens]|uniref:hypothetical protein n=1 Tax=Natrarchaeobaculum sulfurireducens TaxID=2044521 RepID=UPI00105AB096|nr:hypothetical protein [Natrarchaeobaculum sulfurireducens]